MKGSSAVKNITVHRLLAFGMAICLVVASFPPSAGAAIIQTDEAIAHAERQHTEARIHALLAESSVKETLIGLGVDPVAATERVQALTDQELQVLATKLEELPAGGTGIVEVVGIVAIVLIILELLNVTNIFNSF